MSLLILISRCVMKVNKGMEITIKICHCRCCGAPFKELQILESISNPSDINSCTGSMHDDKEIKLSGQGFQEGDETTMVGRVTCQLVRQR
ncbi:uncharacterized protein LOC108227290 isoform X2 [Daucus carota subsp. sativus]|uniref:uncharacterized protein LOC108227290 isoform X2 n=1 Tax=Daucus carota subsp. sativus TaxID=79200 RepID=UPI003083A3F1